MTVQEKFKDHTKIYESPNRVASMLPGIVCRAAQGVTQGVIYSISIKSVNLKLTATNLILITRTNFANNIN